MSVSSAPPLEVFYSYAHADEPYLQELQKHLTLLKRENLISTWHDREILPGNDWAQAIDARLERASIILMLVSPDFLASDYCYEKEMQRALQRHEANEARVVPIVVRPCDWQNSLFVKLQGLPNKGKAITLWKNKDLAWNAVTTGMRQIIKDLQPVLTTHPPQTAHPSVENIPYPRNLVFTGREELLTQLADTLKTGQPTALSQPLAINGLGGIGKTQIAIEYAYRHRQDYRYILWARAESRETLVSSYVALASLLHLPEADAQDQNITVQALKSWLQHHHQWLLILDNADDLPIVREFIPPDLGGHLLLTTRAQSMGRLATPIEVKTFSPEHGAQFLLRRANILPANLPLEQVSIEDHALAKQVTQELGGLPLALDQAGAYLEETGCGLQDYLHTYQQHRQELLKQRRGQVDDHPAAVATTWSISFEAVEKRSPAASDLLRLCACLDPDAIPLEIITAADDLGPQLTLIAKDTYLLDQAIEALRAYSLVNRDRTARMLSLHRLVQAVVRDALPAKKRKQWMQRAISAVDTTFPDVTDFSRRAECNRWLSHALACTIWIEQEHLFSPVAARLLNQIGYYLHERAQYAEAEPLYQRALKIREEQLGATHPDTALSLNNLAALYYVQGKYAEAEPLYQRALKINEEQLGATHPATALSLNNLAALYYVQGKYAEAEPLYQRALKINEEQLGATHPDTALSLNNLAALYDTQGKYAEAEPLYQRALKINEEQLGATHPDTALSLNNLAMLYDTQGKYTEAEPLYQRALGIYEMRLGPDHPTTQIVRKNSIILLQKLGTDSAQS